MYFTIVLLAGSVYLILACLTLANRSLATDLYTDSADLILFEVGNHLRIAFWGSEQEKRDSYGTPIENAPEAINDILVGVTFGFFAIIFIVLWGVVCLLLGLLWPLSTPVLIIAGCYAGLKYLIRKNKTQE